VTDKRAKGLLPSRPACADCGKRVNAIIDYCNRCKKNFCPECMKLPRHLMHHPQPETTPDPGNPRDYRWLPDEEAEDDDE
jgi:predicted amidophosphoribosyltransferase